MILQPKIISTIGTDSLENALRGVPSPSSFFFLLAPPGNELIFNLTLPHGLLNGAENVKPIHLRVSPLLLVSFENPCWSNQPPPQRSCHGSHTHAGCSPVGQSADRLPRDRALSKCQNVTEKFSLNSIIIRQKSCFSSCLPFTLSNPYIRVLVWWWWVRGSVQWPGWCSIFAF